MPRPARTKFPLLPGVYLDDTPSVAEGYVTLSDNMRFRRGKWQVQGGFQATSEVEFVGIVRGCYAWADNNSSRITAYGTAANLYVSYGGEQSDITPLKAKGTLTAPFYTKNGSPTVLVMSFAHGLKDGDLWVASNADAGGGITIDGSYAVEVRDLNSFWITHGSNASSDAGPVGGNVEYQVALDVGRVDGIGGLGYGTGLYGTGLYGVTTSGDINPRQWDVYNWGQFGLFLPENGALYEWIPQPSYDNLYQAGDFTTAGGGTLGTGWSEAADVLTAVAGSASDAATDMTGTIRGGYSYEVTLVVTRSAGGFQFRFTSLASGSPADITLGTTIEKSGTYVRRFTAPALPTLLKIAKDAAFAGTVQITSLKVIPTAYRLQDAPQYSRCMMVDPENRVILGGTVELDGATFNPMHIRWSDVGNNRTWTPADDNGAGFETLRDGSQIRGMIPLKAENLVWTDTSLYYMRRNSTGYDIKPISGSAGLVSKRARAEMDGVVFWWGTDKNFHIYQGGRPQTIDCSVRNDVMDNLSVNQQGKIAAGINPAASEVFWIYPDSRDGDGAECSRKVVYNWADSCWYVDSFLRSDWVKPGVFPNPLAFGLDGMIYDHETGQSANGDALTWDLWTGALDLGEGDTLFNLMSIVPDFEEQAGAISLEVYLRNSQQGAWVLGGTYTSSIASDEIWMRHQARQMKLHFSGNSAPSYARFGDIKASISPTGARR